MANDRHEEVPIYEAAPRDWATHPRKKMLMTPLMVVAGGTLVYAIPTFLAGFLQMVGFSAPVSKEWTPLTDAAMRGRHTYLSNGCIYCHSSYTRPQDVRQGLYYLYPRVSLPGDYASTDNSPNVWGSARIGPDLSQEGGFHPVDWHRAHFSDPRYVTPNSLMPRFDFLTNREMDDLIEFVQLRSGKSGLLRYAGQRYMKKLELIINGSPPPPLPSDARKLTLADVTKMFKMGQIPKSKLVAPVPKGTVDGLKWPNPVELNTDDRSYWLSSNPMPVTTYNLYRGRLLFQDMCIGCHGQGGAGISEAAKFLRPPPADFTSAVTAASGQEASPGDWYYRILRGVRGTAMENFGTRLHVADIWRLVLFLKTIPAGGLQEGVMPTPEMYIQWRPPPGLLQYIKSHPLDANKDFTILEEVTDPFMLEAMRVLNGMNPADGFILPGYGEVSLKAARDEIHDIYYSILRRAWRDFKRRGGYPQPPDSQVFAPPEDFNRLLR